MSAKKAARKTSARKNNTRKVAVVSKRKHVDDEPTATCGAQQPGHPWFCSLAPGHLDENDEPSEHEARIVDEGRTLAISWMQGASSFRSEEVDA